MVAAACFRTRVCAAELLKEAAVGPTSVTKQFNCRDKHNIVVRTAHDAALLSRTDSHSGESCQHVAQRAAITMMQPEIQSGGVIAVRKNMGRLVFHEPLPSLTQSARG